MSATYARISWSAPDGWRHWVKRDNTWLTLCSQQIEPKGPWAAHQNTASCPECVLGALVNAAGSKPSYSEA